MSIDLAALRTRVEDGFGPVAITREELLAVIEDSEISRRVANDALDREAERMWEARDANARADKAEATLARVRAEVATWSNMFQDDRIQIYGPLARIERALAGEAT